MAFGKFGRYHPDGIDVHVGRFDLVALVNREVANRDAEERIVLTKELPIAEIESDPVHVRYILVNLLENALKYSDGPVRVLVGGDPTGARIVIDDDGIGVPPDELEALFSPFFRASNVADRPGTGMGLAIVKKSASLIGAGIAVESAEGAGTTFTISLPLSAAHGRA